MQENKSVHHPFSPNHESKAVHQAVVTLGKMISLLFWICVLLLRLLVQGLVYVPASLTQARQLSYPEDLQVQVFMGGIFPFERRCNEAHIEQRDSCLFCCKVKYHANHICKRRDKETGIPEHEDVILAKKKKKGLIFNFLLRFCKYSWKDFINVGLALTISRSSMKEEAEEKKTQKIAWHFHINDIFYNEIKRKYPEALCKIKFYQKDHFDVNIFTMWRTKLEQFHSSVLCNTKALAFQTVL